MSDVMQQRLELLGRAKLEAAGFTDAVIRKAYGRIPDLLVAKKQKVLQYEGRIVLGPEQEDGDVQLRAVELVTRLADHQVNKLEHEVHGEVKLVTIGLSEEQI
jgi:hypothetical protein